MPIPTPQIGEDQDVFIQRCVSTESMKNEFPDIKQRLGVCYTQWTEK